MKKILEPRVLTLADAEEYVGSADWLKQLVRHGMIHPLPNNGRKQLFDRRDIDRAIDQVKVEGFKKL